MTNVEQREINFRHPEFISGSVRIVDRIIANQ